MPSQLGEPLLDVVGDLDGVGAGLLADLQQHGGLAVDARRGTRFGHAVLDPRHVAQPNRVAVHLAQHHVAEGINRRDASARAQRHRLGALIHAAAGNVGVLRLQRAGHVVDRQFLGAQQRGVEPQVDLAAAAADHHDLPDAVGAFEPPSQDLVGELGDVADRLVGGHRDGDHRRRLEVELLHRRLQHGSRQQRQHAIDAIANFLRGGVGVLLELERDDHLRDAFGRRRGQRVDAADGVDGLLDLVRHLGLDLLRRRAGQPRRHRDRRDVNVGKAIDAKAAEGKQANDRQRQDQHPGEHWTPHAERCKPLHDLPRHDANAVDQPLDAGRHHLLAGLQPARDLDALANRLADGDDALFDAIAGKHEHARGS